MPIHNANDVLTLDESIFLLIVLYRFYKTGKNVSTGEYKTRFVVLLI